MTCQYDTGVCETRRVTPYSVKIAIVTLLIVVIGALVFASWA